MGAYINELEIINNKLEKLKKLISLLGQSLETTIENRQEKAKGLVAIGDCFKDIDQSK